MATKSIYKNINIKNKSVCRSLIKALENAKNKQSKEVVLSKKCIELKGSDIKKIFGDNF